jgi:hypothetical protein
VRFGANKTTQRQIQQNNKTTKQQNKTGNRDSLFGGATAAVDSGA